VSDFLWRWTYYVSVVVIVAVLTSWVVDWAAGNLALGLVYR
jgi:hypothetical protein